MEAIAKKDDTRYFYPLAILSFIAIILILKITAEVLAPLGVAILLVALIYPVKKYLRKFLPNSLSYLGTFIVLTLIVGIFLTGIYLSFSEVAQIIPKYKDSFFQTIRMMKYKLSLNGVDSYEKIKLQELKNITFAAFSDFQGMFLTFILISAYVMLALPEITHWRDRLYHCFSEEKAEKIITATREIGHSFQAYLKGMLICGTLNAVVTYLVSKSLGLELAFTWAILAFLLNFIPVIGAILTVIPPIILSFFQFNDLGMSMVTISCFATSHLIMGNIIEPKIQGKVLSLSPAFILLSLSLWSFLWGLSGALLAAPIMHGLLIACQQFETLKWIPCVLSQKNSACDEK